LGEGMRWLSGYSFSLLCLVWNWWNYCIMAC